MSLFLELIPIRSLSEDILLNAVFGGVIAAIGTGWTLKWGASTGGLDIIALVLSRVNDRSVGTYIFALNSIIILTAGYMYGWEKALYTLVTLYVTTRVIDAIHTRHQKLTALIITTKGEEMKQAIKSQMVRGITVIPAKGAFLNEDKDMLMIVITRYELFDLKRIIKEVDPKAFTNIMQTTEVVGFFRKSRSCARGAAFYNASSSSRKSCNCFRSASLALAKADESVFLPQRWRVLFFLLSLWRLLFSLVEITDCPY